MKLESRDFSGTALSKSLALLSAKDQKKLSLVIVVQILMSIFDLVGVALVGILGALAVTGIEGGQPGSKVDSVLKLLRLNDFSFQLQAGIIGLLSVTILIARTFFSIFFIRKTLKFLSYRASEMTSLLLRKLLSQPLDFIQQRSSQELLFALTSGVNTVITTILGSTVAIISDLAILVVMSLGLFLVDPIIALGTYAIFGTIAFILYRLMHVKAQQLGIIFTELSINSSEKIVEVLNSYREIFVRGNMYSYTKKITNLRGELAETSAEIQFMPSISKYVIETSVVVGALILGAIQFSLKDATHAVATLSVFLAAGSRIAPAILRLQQNAIQIRGSAGSATPTLNLIDDLKTRSTFDFQEVNLVADHKGFVAECKIENLEFKYSISESPTLKLSELNFRTGEITAIAGPSGAGKSTLADLLLGVLIPSSGLIEISGHRPIEAITKWPGAIAYVPQNIYLSDATIRDNIILGANAEHESDDYIWESLRLSSLDGFVSSLPLGLDTKVGENGTKLSGGQKQRLGIARAIYTKPKLLILDEATSALDLTTETEISNSINRLRGVMTLVVIAHRIATIKDCDKIYYLERGIVKASGTFEEVAKIIPELSNQV